MSYTDVFGGNLIFPSRVSYLMLQTAVDVALQWPTEQQITGQNVVADIIDVDATAVGLTIDMPDAQIASTGNKVTFNNVGANAYLVRDITGGTIQTVQPGEQWVLSLTDNSTDAGTWSTFQLGASVAVASASALAGAGIKAIGVLLNQKIDSDVQAATPFTIVDGDRASCQIYTAGAGICNLPGAGAVGNDWFFMLRNSGSGTLNIVPPAGLIDGAADINLDPGGSTFIFTDGVNFFTIGLTIASTIAFDFVSLPVPGSGDFVLSGANLNRIAYRFTGALTGNRRIVVPNTTQQYWVDNQTTGAFTLAISTAAQVGPPTVNQGDTVIFYCDAVDVINAVNTAAIALPVLIAQGGTSATTAPNALLNLGAAASAIEIQTAALSGLSGGGDLTANRPLVLDTDNLTTELTVDVVADTIAFYDDDAGAMRKTPIATIAGVFVEDEGVPLANLGGTLNFVGSGVVASGAGATKTITITTPIPVVLLDNEQIQFGTGTDVTMDFDGTNFIIGGGEDIFVYENAAVTHQFALMNFNGGVAIQIEAGTGDMEINDVVQGTGAFVRTYVKGFAAAGEVWVHYGGVGVLRTAPVSGAPYPYEGTSGGALLNNNTTGTGANERILTYTDHMMTGGLQDDRSLTNTMADDNRLFSGRPCRQGYWKFEIFAYFRRTGGTANIEFDFDSDANISECNYLFDYDTEDGAPAGNGAADDKTTNSAITLGGASEEVMVRITGRFRMSATGTFGFRWRPTVSQLDTVSRMRGSWMTVSPIEIGV